MSLVVEIADAVVTELNGGTFSQEFTAQRLFLPESTLEELADLKVIVVPKTITTETYSRGVYMRVVQIDIGIQKKIGKPETDLLALLDFVQALDTHMRSRVLTQKTDASYVGSENNPIYDQNHLVTDRVFTSLLTLTYHVLVS